jgi:hypothetical protein
MRHLLYMFSLLAITACSNEDMADSAPSSPKTLKSTITVDEGANPANPFDATGRNYLALHDAYEALPQKPLGNEAIILSFENIALSLGVSGEVYDPVVSQAISAVKNQATTNLNASISNLSISSSAKNHLISILNLLESLKQNDEGYDAVYSDLVEFEGTILSSALTVKDKQVLLTTLAITRYAIYNTSRKKRRDRDWELSVGNIMATAYGAVASEPNAVISGAASGFIE